MTLDVAIRHSFGAFTLDVAFGGDRGVIALFGRSGSGKTTVVNAIAGLLKPQAGRIMLDGEVLLDTANGVAIPPHRRRIGYVFQEGRLFPHLSVRGNLLYGRVFARTRADGIELAKVVELLGIGHLLHRRPAALSGGEKQRVAIGRALLAQPRLLLMDEPLASLDELRKREILPYLERLRAELRIPIVYVSHALPEVARLATTLVLLSDGRVAAAGPAPDVLGRIDLFPLTGRAEAGALLHGKVLRHESHHGLTVLAVPGGELFVPLADTPPGGTLRIRVRARDVMLSRNALADVSALNMLRGRIAEIETPRAHAVDVRIDLGGQVLLARVTLRSLEAMGLAPGQEIHAIIKSVAFDRRAVGGPGAPAPRDLDG